MKITQEKSQILGMGAAFLANFIFGFSFMFSKISLGFTKPVVVSASRFTIAFLVMNLLAVTKIIKVDYKGKKLGKLLLMSIAQPFLYFVFELYGIAFTSSALSGLIIALVPVVVMIISALFLSEKPTTFQSICTLVSLLGVGAVSMISNNGEQNRVLGVIMLFGAVVSAAVFNVLSRSEAKNFSPFERTYFMFFVGAIGFNLLGIVAMGKDYVPSVIGAFSHWEFVLSICYLAIISSVLAFILYNYATSHISVIKSSSFSNITTVVSVLAGLLILDEKFSIYQILLCIPIVLGVWGVNLKKE